MYNDDDGEWVPADHIDRLFMVGVVIFILFITIMAIDLWTSL
jgi:hypothetical protein